MACKTVRLTNHDDYTKLSFWISLTELVDKVGQLSHPRVRTRIVVADHVYMIHSNRDEEPERIVSVAIV
jgi:hypothetical protein